MFCGNCGSQIEPNTRFCGKCGSPADAPAQPVAAPPVQPAAYAPATPQAAAPARKGLGPVAWVLIIVFGLFALGVVAVGVGGAILWHKVKQAGFDPALIEKKPELAFIKMALTNNPDAELVSIDEDRGIVQVRDKKTGKVITMNFEDIRKGRLSFSDETGQKVSIEAKGEGDQGSVEVKTNEGTARFGAGAVKLPAWIPAYAGATLQGFSTTEAQGSSGAFSFSTGDSAEKVTAFYEGELKKAGFTVEVTRHPAGATLSGENGQKRVILNALSQGSGSAVSGTFEDK